MFIEDYDDYYFDGENYCYTGAILEGEYFYEIIVSTKNFLNEDFEVMLFKTSEDYENGYPYEERRYEVTLRRVNS